MQIVETVLVVLMTAALAGTLWAHRPISLAKAADARIRLESRVAVVVCLDEMDGDAHTSYEAYDPTLLGQMELLVDTTRLHLVQRNSIVSLDGMCKIVIIGEDNTIYSFDCNLTTDSTHIGDWIYAPRSTQSALLSELVPVVCGEVQVMGLQWKYLWPGLVLAAVLALGLGAVLRPLCLAFLGERIGVVEGTPLRQVVVKYNDGDGHGPRESNEPVLSTELPPLLVDTRLHYNGFTDGGVPVSPAVYTVTVYSAPTEEGCTFGVDDRGCAYQDNRRYSASPEQAEELMALLKRICS